MSHPTVPSPSVVLFDLDGTLIDSITLIVEAARHAFDGREGRRPTDDEWRASIGRPLVHMFRDYCTTEAEVEGLVQRYREYQLAHHDRLVSCYDEVVDSVAALKAEGRRVGVVTSKVEWLAEKGLRHVGLLEHMDVIIGCDATEKHKPDPEPLLLALERLGADRRDTVYVGDSPFDLMAARAAGLPAIAVLWGASTRDQLAPHEPVALLERMSELPAALASVKQ